MPSIHLGFNIVTALVLLLVVIACAVAMFFYRSTVPPIPRWKRLLLTALRATSLSLVLLLLFEPLLRLTVSSTQLPVLAVLVDNSKSMRIKDKTGDRKSVLSATLQDRALNQATQNADVKIFTFGTKLREAPSQLSDSLALDEEATDISAALRTLAGQKESGNIRAVLLLGDGSYNLGQNPIYEAEQLGIPIYAVGIGDSSEQKDILIAKVSTNDLVYNETEVPVDVTIKSSGFTGERVEVTLLDGAKELNRSQVVLQEGTREYPVHMMYTPEGEGTKKYSVRVSSLRGELTADNNRKTFFARVLKSKLRVLIIAGGPSPDVSIIKQTLREEKNLDVRSYIQRSTSDFFEGQLTKTALDSADCLVLVGFPAASTPDAILQMIANALGQDNKPVLFIDGKSVSEAKLRALAPLLPFTSAGMSTVEQYVFVQLSPTQKNNPIINSGSVDATGWDRLPPIFRKQATYRAKTEATILGVARILNVVTNEPLLLMRSVNRQKSFAVLGYGLWRWRLMTQGTAETEKLLPVFLANSIRWLTTRDDSKPVRVTSTKDLYTQGEQVEFTGQVYDASANPVDDAQLKVTVQREAQEFETTLRSIGSGRYEGTIDGLPAGDYTVRSIGIRDGVSLGEDRGRFAMGELNLEFQDTKMNVSLLRQLAFRTGGKYYAPMELASFAGDIAANPSLTSREVQSTTELELWNWQYMLATIILVLAAEWFIRKRSGML